MTLYRERQPDPGLGLACVWTQATDRPHPQLVVPDGCVDVIRFADGIVVAGPDTGPRVVRLAAGARLAAVRFRPGRAPHVLGLPASELRDRTVPLEARQLHRRCLAAFGYGPKTLQRVVRFQRALRSARRGTPLVEVVCSAGYADQAHLARDVRALAGVPLTALR